MQESKEVIVTEDGRVFLIEVKELPQHKEQCGYMRLASYDFLDERLVHRLVAKEHVHNPDPIEKVQVNHIDKDKTNNHKDNLEWVTAQENIEHSIAKHWSFISPEGKRKEIKNITKFCRENGLSQAGFWRLSTGKTNNYKGWTRVEGWVHPS